MLKRRSIRGALGAALLATLGLSTLLLAGCPSGSATPMPGGSGAGKTSGGGGTSSAGAHEHPTEGPHHGDLVELGDEEYHAEVVHGSGGKVTVYILDSRAKAAVPIEAAELTINLSHDGKAEQFKLPADPDNGDGDGKASRFSLEDKELAKDLDREATTARLVVSINGKSYTGKIEHRHDHAHGGEGHDEKGQGGHAHDEEGHKERK